ncbi:hypothetical protein MBAV_003986 [Candidatus Magnetobacterium bavaricum]|uniref:Uncharacterized protein n=1 Tax=Candidatus Magnetobacterium bavaricum TaxID=29290 RepID=A0A0F3GPL6_9BACT|nr:hypothetical protein MBAV_003986 [Candidatus Magnetobacterium bavaricum]
MKQTTTTQKRSAATNEITHTAFRGLVNVVPTREASSPELSDLKSAVNVDIDNFGNVVTRPGFLRVYEGKVHSLYSNGKLCLFRQDDRLLQLYQVSGAEASSPDVVAPYAVRTLTGGINGSLRMSYQYVAGRVYYSDAAVTGVVEVTARPIPVVRSWGILPPDAPVLSATTAGILSKGQYQVTLTYTRNDGQESGASTVASIALAPGRSPLRGGRGGGIDIICPLSADPNVRKINIYVSAPNGEVPYLAASVDNTPSDTVSGFTVPYHYRGETITGPPLLNWGLKPPPPGHLLCYYRGRLYVASLNTLWYSQPYTYELFDPAQGWLAFDNPITLVAAVEDGIFVATSQEVVFLKGTEPEKFQLMQLSDCGAVFGTQAMGVLPGESGRSEVVFWESRMGKCAGLSGGRIQFLTADTYNYEVGEIGTGVFWQRNGMQLYLSIMQGPTMPPVNPQNSLMTTRDKDSGSYSLAMPVPDLQSVTAI